MTPMNRNGNGSGDRGLTGWGNRPVMDIHAVQAGYEDMGAINLQFASSYQEHDLSQLVQYETILARGQD